MTPHEQYEVICQRVLRKHYRAFRKVVSDPFFVSSETQAKAQLTKMLRNARMEAEEIVQVERWDSNSRRIAEILLGKYMHIGKKYGERYYRRKLKELSEKDSG